MENSIEIAEQKIAEQKIAEQKIAEQKIATAEKILIHKQQITTYKLCKDNLEKCDFVIRSETGDTLSSYLTLENKEKIRALIMDFFTSQINEGYEIIANVNL